MAFWENKKSEPKRSFRWIVNFPSNNSVPFEFIKNVTKPSFTVNSKRIQGLGYAVNMAQQVQYQPVKITLIDDQKNTVTDWVYQYFSSAGLLFDGSQAAQTCIETEYAKRRADNIEIKMLKADGTSLEIWTLHNAWVSSFEQSELTYETNDLATYTLTLTYDWFSYTINSEPKDKVSAESTGAQQSSQQEQEQNSAEEAQQERKPRPGPDPLTFPELFPPGPSVSSAYESDRRIFEYDKRGEGNAYDLKDSMTVEDIEFDVAPSGRRLLGTGRVK